MMSSSLSFLERPRRRSDDNPKGRVGFDQPDLPALPWRRHRRRIALRWKRSVAALFALQEPKLFSKGTLLASIVRRSTGAILVVLALAFSAAGAAQAQQQYDQAKLESFVVAALEVNRLVEEWTPRIQGAQNETEAATMRDQANGELVDAINQSSGITVDEYREISQAAQSDPALMERISAIFEELQPEQQ
jgi:hypothetical protein